MINLNFAQVEKGIVHWIGNKSLDEPIKFSESELLINNFDPEVLNRFFLKNIKDGDLFSLCHEVDLNLNEVFTFAKSIFENNDNFKQQSQNIAKYLHQYIQYPNIKSGELYIIHLKECVLNGENVEGLGIFKTENKDVFMKVISDNNDFQLERNEGVALGKLDKGCIIFNTDKENGFFVSIADRTSKGQNAHYWVDDFLHVRQRQDEYFNTNSVLSMTKNYVVKELPKEFDVNKADQADILNKSLEYFKEKEEFDLNEFATEVIQQPEIIKSFNNYRTEYEKDREIELSDNFQISESAVKKQQRAFKSVIKLDKNFHIYVHGNNQYIKKRI